MDPRSRSAASHMIPGDTAAPAMGMTTDRARKHPRAFFDSVRKRTAASP